MKSMIVALLLAVTLAAGLYAAEPEFSVANSLSRMPLAFTQNQGQWDETVFFRADAGKATMWFTADGAYYQFVRKVEDVDNADATGQRAPHEREAEQEADKFESIMIKASFVGANPSPEMFGEDELDYKCNFFIGDDPTGWRTDVANYESVTYKEVYPGIDLKYYGNGREMEYDFIVSPGADLSKIRVKYEGVESVSMNDQGELVVTTAWGEVIERRPVVFQLDGGTRTSVEGQYRMLADNSFGFALDGDYNPDLPVVIDPVLSYSTYLGGSSSEEGNAVAVDASGAAYVTGYTNSTNFPLQNPGQGDPGDLNSDAFITKLSSTGDALTYSTYLGGNFADYGFGIAVDASGLAYITGYTSSTNFPTYLPSQATNAGSPDAFVTALGTGGNTLVYSTYLGGTVSDYGRGIAVDDEGAAYITGYTYSSNFPNLGPYQTHPGDAGYTNAFVTKLNNAGARVYSTYLGGTSYDFAFAIAVDTSGAAYVAGYTYSTGFPTESPIYGANAGFYDVFVTKFTSAGNALIYSTYVGGSSDEYCWGIAVDTSGAAYVGGYTYSVDYPTQNPYQLDPGDGASDVFVTKLNSAGDALDYSTYLGGSNYDYGRDIAVDLSGSAYVAGNTSSTDFPTLNEYQLDPGDGTGDGFVTKLSTAGDLLVYSTYLGGAGNDVIWGVAIDASGAAYVVGYTGSTDFPTLNEYQLDPGDGAGDVFVTKFEAPAKPQISAIADMTIGAEENSTVLNLDNFVSDDDNTADELTWEVSSLLGHYSVTVVNRVATIAITGERPRSDVLTFIARDPYMLEDTAVTTITAQAASVEVCSDLAARRYHMISLPVTPPDNSVEAILGDAISGTEAYDWRLGRWNPSSQTYVDVSSLTPGNAYWLITSSRVSVDIPGTSIAPTTDGYYSVALSSGWNQVGAKCIYPVDFSGSVVNVGGTLYNLGDDECPVRPVLYHYASGGYDSLLSSPAPMVPGDGYWIYTEAACTLLLPGGPGVASKPAAPSISDDWYVKIEAECGEHNDRANYLGVRSNVTNGVDRYDFPEPPPLSPYVSVAFEGGLTTDYRKSVSEGTSWRFSVRSDVEDIATIRFDTHGLPDGGSALVLVDLANGRQTPITDSASYSFFMVSDEREFEVRVLNAISGLPSGVPKAFALHNNYPNPFNPATAIGYALPKACHAKLTVYNVVGQRVRVLVDEYQQAGEKLVLWDGRNATGESVATGLYFYRLEAGDYLETKKMMLLK